MSDEKICTKCQVWKPLRRFGKSKASSDGHKGHCSACISIYNKKRKAEYRTPSRH